MTDIHPTALAWLCHAAIAPCEPPAAIAEAVAALTELAALEPRRRPSAAGAAVLLRLRETEGARLATVGRWLAHHLKHGGLEVRVGRGGALHLLVDITRAPLAWCPEPVTLDAWRRVRADLVARHHPPG